MKPVLVLVATVALALPFVGASALTMRPIPGLCDADGHGHTDAYPPAMFGVVTQQRADLNCAAIAATQRR